MTCYLWVTKGLLERFSLLLLILFLASHVQGREDKSAVANNEVIAFLNVNVVPMDEERILQEQTVVVINGIITKITPVNDVTVPPDATRIDGSGKYLMPGFAEMHAHLPGPGYSKELTENILFLYVANGVTLLRGMQGHPQQLDLREKIKNGEMIGPRLFISSPPLSGRNTNTPQIAEAKVRESKAAGYDHLKIHENLSLEVYDTIVRTAHELQIPFAGHVSNYVGLHRALQSGQHTVDHLDNYIEALVENRKLTRKPVTLTPAELVAEVDESKIPEIVAKTVKASTAVVPTMALWELFFGNATRSQLQQSTLGLEYLPNDMVNDWVKRVSDSENSSVNKKIIKLRRKLLKALSDGGATILFGTDSPQLFSVPGFSIHKEMQIMVESGMTPYQVLTSGTSDVGKFYDGKNEFGQVAVGMSADLILIDGNPIIDISNVGKRSGVMLNGRWFEEKEIQKRLKKIANSYKKNYDQNE
jgi:imidazolonepropionase-like amidohydrolase